MASSLFRYCRNPSYSLLNAGNFGARLLAFSTSIQDDPGGDATKKAALNDLLLASYRQLLERGVLLPDATQATAVHALQTLQNAVLHGEKLRSSFSEEGSANTEFSPCRPDGNGSGDSSSSSSSSSSSRRNGFGVSSNANGRQIGNNKLPIPAAAAGGGEPPAVHIAPKPHTVRGAYLWGPVGSGKTALMDLFASTTRQCLEAAAAATAAHTAQLGAASARVTAAAATAAHGTSLLLRSAGRQHYHEFMQSVHGRLHELHQALPRVVARNRQGRMVYRYAEPEEDPLVTVARELGSRTAVLCLDELHVTDVADAMILSRLFGALLVDFDTTVVFTSNRPPKDLYKGGLSRKYFEPFVQLVYEQMVVLRVAADVDYRLTGVTATATTRNVAPAEAETSAAETGVVRVGSDCSTTPTVEREVEESAFRKESGGHWFFGSVASQRLHNQWRRRAAAAAAAARSTSEADGATDVAASGQSYPQLGVAGAPATVPLAYGRTLKVPCALGDAAFFTFEQLCGAKGLRAAVDDGGALAAPDFLALCRRFREIYITDVPQLGPAHRDEARRFVTLLDVAYDNRCYLSVAASVPMDILFVPLLEEAHRQGVDPRLGLPKNTSVSHQVGPMAGGGNGVAATEGDVTAADANRSDDEFAGSSISAPITALKSAAVPLSSPSPSPSPPPPPTTTTGSHHPAMGIGGSGLEQQRQHQNQQVLSTPKPGDLTLPWALLWEEVLMYHRAASRLAEMCPQVVRAG
ncbi:hypothetical protein Vretimale_14823 [Volvox reticuliferus]|nr:hypothetical protein Vretimale_14823 [Volvox reticuliferus]